MRGRRSGREAEQTRTAILTVAMRLFADRGFDPVSLRDIAAAAGFTHGLIRHHFGAKDDVWRAVVEHADRVYLEAMSAAIRPGSDDPVAALRTIILALTEATARHPEITRLLIGESIRGGPRLRQIVGRMAPLRAALTPIVERLLTDGRTGLDADTFFLVLLLAGAGPFGLTALSAEVAGPDLTTVAGARRHADMLLQALVGR